MIWHAFGFAMTRSQTRQRDVQASDVLKALLDPEGMDGVAGGGGGGGMANGAAAVAGGGTARGAFVDAFYDRFLPRAAEALATAGRRYEAAAAARATGASDSAGAAAEPGDRAENEVIAMQGAVPAAPDTGAGNGAASAAAEASAADDSAPGAPEATPDSPAAVPVASGAPAADAAAPVPTEAAAGVAADQQGAEPDAPMPDIAAPGRGQGIEARDDSARSVAGAGSCLSLLLPLWLFCAKRQAPATCVSCLLALPKLGCRSRQQARRADHRVLFSGQGHWLTLHKQN
jgi:hypothetical protein